MPQEDQASRAFYDHELDEAPRTGGRRRRPAGDWGVGEDLFARMPSRRFSHHRDDEWGAAPRNSAPENEWRDDEAPRPRSGADPRRFEKRPPREHHAETWDDDAVAAWGGEELAGETRRT